MGIQTSDPRRGAAIELQQMIVRQRMAERINDADRRRLARQSRGGRSVPGANASSAVRAAFAAIRAFRLNLSWLGAMRLKVSVFLSALLVVGCAATAAQPASTASTSKQPAATASSGAAAATAIAANPTPVETPTPVPPRSASCGNPPASGSGSGVTLYHDPTNEVDNQVELVSASGKRVLIDVGIPESLSRAPTADDILLTTHEPAYTDSWYEPDINVLPEFVAAFPGHVIPKAGSLSVGEFQITGMWAAHGTSDGPATIVDGTDSIYVVEVGGLRIADFGDFGQVALTQEQLDRLGRVDVAITQFDNSYSSVSAANHRAFDMLAQICPRIVIPTEMGVPKEDLAVARTMWKAAEYSPNNHVHLTPATLPAQTTLLLLGDSAKRIGPAEGLTLSAY